MPDAVSRRGFLKGALGVGVGAAALTAARSIGAAGEASAAPVPGGLSRAPGVPVAYQRFVTRPDLRPPGVWIDKTAAAVVPGQPAYIFATVNADLGPYPAGAQTGLMIFDRDGFLVFFRPLSGANTAFNFRVQPHPYQGRPVLGWFQGTLGAGYSTAGSYQLADASYTTIATVGEGNTGVPCDLHEFLLTDRGTALRTGYQRSGNLLAGHAFDVDIPTGEPVFHWWSTMPRYGVSPADSYVPGADYFHINSIDLWPGPARDLLVSARNTSCVYLIERATGRIAWRAGGKASWAVMGAGCRYEYQHDARALPDGSGFSVFDDASQPGPEKQAWAKTIHLDQAAHPRPVAILAQQLNHYTDPVDVPFTGNNQLLGSGDRFVGWGAQPFFSQYTAGGEMILDGRFPGGVGSYRTFTADWTARPRQDELAFVVRRDSRPGTFTGYASWNGATDAAYWRVWGGPSWQYRAQVPRHGFETAIPFTASGASNFRAYAHDVHGNLLGTSRDVPAT